MTALTRGPLPARVYWTRRVLVLGTALLLVVGLARLFGVASGSDGGGDAGGQRTAVQAAAAASSSPAEPSRSVAGPVPSAAPPVAEGEKRKKRKKKQDDQPVLVDPEGICTADDIAVTPAVEDAEAGRRVLIVLELRTIESAACTWQVSPETLTVKITSGDDDIWSSRQCPRALPTRSVVVRQAVSTRVGVRWSGKRSDEECSGLAGWAMPGWYHVAAAALAGEPSDVQFELERPRPEVVVETVPAEPRTGKKDRKGDGAGNGSGKNRDQKKDPPKHR